MYIVYKLCLLVSSLIMKLMFFIYLPNIKYFLQIFQEYKFIFFVIDYTCLYIAEYYDFHCYNFYRNNFTTQGINRPND